MTMYFTRVWAFDEPHIPLLFSLEGHRNTARNKLKQGDLVVLVCVLGDNAENKEEKGRVLGIVEPSTEVVSSSDFEFSKTTNPKYHDKEGNFKWPFGLLNKKAWVLIERPLFSDIIENRKFDNRLSASTIIELTKNEEEKILKLDKREIGLLKTTFSAERKVHGRETVMKRAIPPSTTKRKGVMQMRRAPASTYCMEIIGAEKPSFKIGWAFDYVKREKQFNKSSLPNLGGVKYSTIRYEDWKSAKEAFQVEQYILTKLDKYRDSQNSEVIVGLSKQEIERIWIEISKKYKGF